MIKTSRQMTFKVRMLFFRYLLLPLLNLILTIRVSLKTPKAWVNPFDIGLRNGVYPSFMRRMGSLIRTPDGKLHLVTRYGGKTLSRSTAEALTIRNKKAAFVLWVIFLVSVGEAFYILNLKGVL